MNRGARIRASLPLLVLFICGSAGAVPTTYGDKTAWDAAVAGGDIFFEDFSGVVSDQSFGLAAVDAGPFSIAQVDGNGDIGGLQQPSSNLIDVSLFEVPTLSLGEGSYVGGFAKLDLNPDNRINVWVGSFDAPIFAWGADFNNANGPTGLNIRLVYTAGGFVDIPGPSFNDIGFYGFADDSGATYSDVVIWASAITAVGETFGMDNVTGASVPVPEPETAVLLALGLTGLAVCGRRRT